MSQTIDNILPAATGQDLGTPDQRWDLFAQTADVSGNANVSNNLTVGGVATLATAVIQSTNGASTFNKQVVITTDDIPNLLVKPTSDVDAIVVTPDLDGETANAFAVTDKVGTTLKLAISKSGQVQSGVPDGTPPFTVLSSTVIDSLNVNYLQGKTAASFPNLVASSNLTGQSASVAEAVLYTPPTSGFYRVNYYFKVSVAATTSSIVGGMTVKWVDPDDSTVQTATSATSTGNTTAAYVSGSHLFYAKAATPVSYSQAYASTGATAMQYGLHVDVEKL